MGIAKIGWDLHCAFGGCGKSELKNKQRKKVIFGYCFR